MIKIDDRTICNTDHKKTAFLTIFTAFLLTTAKIFEGKSRARLSLLGKTSKIIVSLALIDCSPIGRNDCQEKRDFSGLLHRRIQNPVNILDGAFRENSKKYQQNVFQGK